MGLGSVSLLDFEEKTYITRSSVKLFTNGNVKLPNNSNEGLSIWNDKNYYLKFEVKDGKRDIYVKIKNYSRIILGMWPESFYQATMNSLTTRMCT